MILWSGNCASFSGYNRLSARAVSPGTGLYTLLSRYLACRPQLNILDTQEFLQCLGQQSVSIAQSMPAQTPSAEVTWSVSVEGDPARPVPV